MLKRDELFKTTAIALALQTGAAIMAAPAIAQDDDAAEDDSDVIIVTSRKRAESLLDAPVAVSAFSAQDIREAGFQSILDIAQATPGFVFESYNSLPGRQDSVPFIRGVVFDNVDPLAQTVSVFLDGVYIAGGTKALGNEDIERIEVIKGPQSAIFGRSTFAGAINYVTKGAPDEFTANLSLLAATRDEYEVMGSIAGPLLGDVVSGRLSARWSHNGGHYENTAVPGQNLGHEGTVSVNGTLFIEPTENWTMKLRGAYTRLDDGPAAVTQYDSTNNNFGPLFPGGETIFAGVLSDLPDPVIALNTSAADFQDVLAALGDDFEFINGRPDEFGLEGETTRLSLQSSYEFGESGITFDAILGYNKDDSTLVYDNDFSGDAAFAIVNQRQFDDFSAEARLSGSLFSDKLDWSAGFSYTDVDFTSSAPFAILPFGSRFGGAPSTDTAKTTAGFFQLSYAIVEQLNVSFEGRYQVDDIDNRNSSGASVPGAPSKFKNFLPRAIVDFKPWTDTLVYFSYSEGNLPGGFNSNFFDFTPAQQAEIRQEFPNASGTFGEEKLVNYELGWKQSFPDYGVTLATAAFFMERSNQLATTVVSAAGDASLGEPERVSGTLTLNDATSEIKGIEFEGTWDPTDSLTLGATAAYVDTEIVAFPPTGDAGKFADVFGPDADFTGIQAERFPNWQASFSATYTTPYEVNVFGLAGNLYGRADFFYAGRYFLTNVNVGQAPSVQDLRLRTGFRADNFSFELFATNVLDEDAPVTANNGSDLSNATPLFTFGVEATNIGLRDRRQFGFRTTFDF